MASCKRPTAASRKHTSRSGNNWACLQTDLLISILDYIIEYPTILRFSSVCKPWRLVALLDHHNNKNQLLPISMIYNIDNTKQKTSLYTVTEQVLYDIRLPLPCERRIFGSSHGWLFAMDSYRSNVITLVNPLSNRTIRLPEFKDPDYNDHTSFFYRGILSSDPRLDPHNYLVLIIFRDLKKLALLRSGVDETWKFINILSTKSNYAFRDHAFSDVIYYNGYVYAVDNWGELVELDISSSSATNTIYERVVIEPSRAWAYHVYIVESSQEGGRLLLAQKFPCTHIDVEPFCVYSHEFHVYKLEINTKQSKWTWVKVNSLPGEALFSGEKYSRSLVSSTSTYSSFRHNCIYFTGHRFDLLSDMTGIFRLEDQRFDKHSVTDPTQIIWFPPIWIDSPKFKAS